MIASPAPFRRALLAWYGKHGRDLPWRRTRDPYAILVAEFMLQQTQVATVLPYYERWMRRFPTFAALAAASESEVLHAWQGLGYYNRARNLHATAQRIVDKHDSTFPLATKLPGVGRYTANAVATFAFDSSVPIVEANIARVLSRVHNITISIDSAAGRDALWSAAQALLPRTGAGKFNSALMDLGALICTREPKCTVCPVKRFCGTRDPLQLPIKNAKPQTKYLTENYAFDFRGGKVLLEQSSGRWRGMRILPRTNSSGRAIYASRFAFTNHRIDLIVFARTLSPNETRRWFTRDQLDAIAMPSPHRRALNALLARSDARMKRVAS
ncbi:MAG: A/G-specific adenine glycosylase [Chthoniobacterales bacterium]